MFVLITIASEAFLLLVATQAGFIDGPRVMANMALDNWLPRRFGALSDRLTMQNGILLIGGAALLLLLYTGGDIRVLVVMYSINVFVTFTLSQTAMIRLWYSERKFAADWKKNISIHAVGFVLCVSILAIMAIEKFTQGAWVTILITLTCITLCFAIRRHYRRVVETIVELRDSLDDLPELIEEGAASPAWLDRAEGIKQTAVILVSGYDGLGVHLFLNILRNFPKTFDQVVFISVGVIDTAFFRNTNHIAAVDERTRQALERYVGLARKLGLKSELAYRIGTDVVGEASELCIETARTHPRCI
ncbi:amino acid permease, partial [Candidatus Sumerlaeota bacterium]|nr:amino acid permease [Candidatus Sumerlaeota bacterium]